MNKFLIYFGLAFTVLLAPLCHAGDEMADLKKESKKAKKELKKEQKKLKKQREEEKALLEKEMKDLSKKQRREQAAMKRSECKHKSKKKKEEDGMAAEEAKMHKEFAKEHSKKVSKFDKVTKEEKHRMKQLAKEKKAREKKAREHLAKQKKEERKRAASLREMSKQEKKEAKREAHRAEIDHLKSNWRNVRKSEVTSEYKDGKYADLQMIPAWPFSNWFFSEKAMFNVNATYWYATDAYDSNGANRNATILAFGEHKIKLQDILLASKLLAQGKVDRVVNSGELGAFILCFPDYKVRFNGKAEKYGLEFDFARHIFRDDITIGVQVPVLYMKNHLDARMSFPKELNGAFDDNAEAVSLLYKEELHRVLKAKGIKELGGSATGFGDITLFGNVEVTTKYVDKIILGLKVGLPTAKGQSMTKLWAPSLSANDKCTEFAAFASILVNYNTYVNPHLSLQASFFSTSHVNKRVPHKVSTPEDAQVGEQVGSDVMAMGDRVQYADDGTGAAKTWDEYDSTIRCFADHPVKLKFEKGPEFHVRLGNVFSKFISRRGFFDIFYDLRAKLEDDFRGLNLDSYDVHQMKENTKAVEHRVGMEYSHQFDRRTYLKANLNYSFAGTNALKVFDIGCSLGHSF